MKLPKGFGGGMNIQSVMAQAQQAMERAKHMEEELADERLPLSQNGVDCVFDGRGQMISIKIDPSLVDPDDIETLEDVISAAVRAGFDQAIAVREAKMAEIMPNVPNLPGLPF